MPASAPRIDSRLVAALALLDDRTLPIAELNRRLGDLALQFGLFKPSYEQVRVLVHLTRTRLSRRTHGLIGLDLRLRVRPPAALFDAPRTRVWRRPRE